MQVILLKDLEKLGQAGEIIKVKDGHGRNLLIPRGLATEVSGKNGAKFLENEKKKLALKQGRLKGKAEELKNKLENVSCTITMAAGEDNKLYGEVTPEMIADVYRQEGLDVDKRKIILEKPIRNLGVYRADIKLQSDVIATVKIWVVKK